MQKILAISGGIDSVVMLHKFSKDPSVIVAHFDHGIRENSALDRIFVENLAKNYHLDFIYKASNLGPQCSEAKAREARYTFLHKLASQHQATIYTAHHQDDLIESIAINILRGTGWRGLAPLSHPGIERPLLSLSKKDIYRYAAAHQLSFRQDPTNNSDDYLRNRVRRYLNTHPINRETILALADSQKQLSLQIDQLIATLLSSDGIYYRADFQTLNQSTALEILRQISAKAGQKLTHPQALELLNAIKNYQPGKFFNLPQGRLLRIEKNKFMLK